MIGVLLAAGGGIGDVALTTPWCCCAPTPLKAWPGKRGRLPAGLAGTGIVVPELELKVISHC